VTTDPEREGSHPTRLIGVGSAATPLQTASCPVCAVVRRDPDAFCENCGHDFFAPTARWTLEARADRDYYERLRPDGIEFPTGAPTSWFALDGDEIVIGRAAGSFTPDIDLADALGDPGVSRRQLLFVRDATGGYAALDPGSTNGTFVNEGTEPIAQNQPVSLTDGARVHVGAWTTIVVHHTETENETRGDDTDDGACS
jgi:hypothetical protein